MKYKNNVVKILEPKKNNGKIFQSARTAYAVNSIFPSLLCKCYLLCSDLT